jgi:hypothetical protein
MSGCLLTPQFRAVGSRNAPCRRWRVGRTVCKRGLFWRQVPVLPEASMGPRAKAGLQPPAAVVVGRPWQGQPEPRLLLG